MKMFKKLAVAAALSLTLPAFADVVFLDFEGIAAPNTSAPIGNFYAGLGVSFSDNALAINGYNGTGEPSPTSVLYFLEGDAATLNYANGFNTGFSFYYSSNSDNGMVTVWDGLNSTGNVLAQFALSRQYDTGCTGGGYCNWDPIGVAFAGTAHSIDFAGAPNYIAFDNVTFGTDVPVVPEPSTYALMVLGLAGIGFVARRRKSA